MSYCRAELRSKTYSLYRMTFSQPVGLICSSKTRLIVGDLNKAPLTDLGLRKPSLSLSERLFLWMMGDRQTESEQVLIFSVLDRMSLHDIVGQLSHVFRAI